MLKHIDPLLGPELLCHLRAMGHGDVLVIADGNFPATRLAQRLIRLDGANVERVLTAVLSVLPLDGYVPASVQMMTVVGTEALAPIADLIGNIVLERSGAAFTNLGRLDRPTFYEKAGSAYLVIATGETRLYGNVLLTKGVIEPVAPG